MGKKKIQDIESALMQEIGSPRVPREFVEFQLCQEMGWTLEYVWNLPEEDYKLTLGFLSAQGYAANQKQRMKKRG
jgi:hypothetical protein